MTSESRSGPRDRLLTAHVVPPRGVIPTAMRVRFCDGVLPLLAVFSGVTSAALMTSAPGLRTGDDPVDIDGHLIDTPASRPSAPHVRASHTYLAAIDLPILRGRSFDGVVRPSPRR